jgi:hypothetical protein
MPEELVRTALLSAGPIGEGVLVRLASLFEVSERAMTVRLISLELLTPVRMALILRTAARDWCVGPMARQYSAPVSWPTSLGTSSSDSA